MSVGFPDIEVRPGAHCLFASLRALLAFELGADMSEAEIYFRCDGMNVEYSPSSRPYWIGRSGEGMLDRFNGAGPVRLRYSFGRDDMPPNRELPGDIAAELASGKPVLLFVHSGALTYHPVYRENPSRPHVVFLYGMDEQKDLLFVGDSFLLDYSGTAYTYKGEAALSDVSRGIYGAAFMAGRQPDDGGGEQAFVRILQERIGRFLDKRPQETGANPVFRGLQAYDAFFGGLEGAATADKESFTGICKEVYYCLRIGSIMHQWTYLMQIAEKYPAVWRHGADYWTEKLEKEQAHWKKHLLHLYKTGLRSDQASWPSILNTSRQLLDRQAGLLQHFLEDLTVPAQS